MFKKLTEKIDGLEKRLSILNEKVTLLQWQKDNPPKYKQGDKVYLHEQPVEVIEVYAEYYTCHMPIREYYVNTGNPCKGEPIHIIRAEESMLTIEPVKPEPIGIHTLYPQSFGYDI